MAATQPNTVITVAENSDKTSLTLLDETGIYNGTTNLTGYGLPGGPTVNDVTALTIRVTMYALTEVYFQYAFTLVNGTITVAALSLDGATGVDILADLPSTTWPFTTAFDLFADYGVSIPEKQDDLYKIDYTIAGTTAIGSDVFSFLTTKFVPIKTDKQCCVNQKFADLEVDCPCDHPAMNNAMKGEALIKTFENAGSYGKITPALTALTELTKLCAAEDCGC